MNKKKVFAFQIHTSRITPFNEIDYTGKGNNRLITCRIVHDPWEHP